MSIGDYLRGRQGGLLLHLAGMLALPAFLLLTGTAPGVVCIVLMVWALGLCVAEGAGWLRQKRRLEEAWAVLDGLPQKYLLMECLPKPGTAYEAQWHQLMRAAGKSMIEAVSAAEGQQREYREYIERWVHEIKVPITAVQLICENNRSDTTRKIRPQLAEIEMQVERALFYARSGQVEKDFVVRKTLLAAPVEAALARHRTLLIQSGVRVEARQLGIPIYTDAKWLEFIVGQLLANAVKYGGEAPLITITGGQSAAGATLVLEDNGIGIPAAELPRVFDKGFTGSNGRSRGGATGMGLYLCKRLAGHLGAGLTIESQENHYTRVTLSFPQAAAPQGEA